MYRCRFSPLIEAKTLEESTRSTQRPEGHGHRPADRDWLDLLDRRGSPSIDPQALAEGAVQAALYFSGAPRGNLQLVDPNGALRIAAQQGFDEPFLEFFRTVHSGLGASCGVAHASHAPVVVEDVTTSPIFVGTPALEVMLEAKARSCASFPIPGRLGGVVGVLSVHFEEAGAPAVSALRRIESLAERVGRLL